MNITDIILLGGLSINLLATVMIFSRAKVSVESRLTRIETLVTVILNDRDSGRGEERNKQSMEEFNRLIDLARVQH